MQTLFYAYAPLPGTGPKKDTQMLICVEAILTRASNPWDVQATPGRRVGSDISTLRAHDLTADTSKILVTSYSYFSALEPDVGSQPAYCHKLNIGGIFGCFDLSVVGRNGRIWIFRWSTKSAYFCQTIYHNFGLYLGFELLFPMTEWLCFMICG